MLDILTDILNIYPEQSHIPEGYLKPDCVARGWTGDESVGQHEAFPCLHARAPTWGKGRNGTQ